MWLSGHFFSGYRMFLVGHLLNPITQLLIMFLCALCALQHRFKGNLNNSGTSVYFCRSEQISPLLPFFSFCWLCRKSRAHCGEHRLYVYHEAVLVRLACLPSTALNLNLYKSNCCMFKDLLLYPSLEDVRFFFFFTLRLKRHLFCGSIYKKQPFDLFFQHQSPSGHLNILLMLKKNKTEARQGGIFNMRLLYFNQPVKRYLIGMLIRSARSLLVQRCLYAVWLGGNNNTPPIRDRSNSPIPHAALTVCSRSHILCPLQSAKEQGMKAANPCTRLRKHTRLTCH